MREKKNRRSLQMNGPSASKFLLMAVALLVSLPPAARAQQEEEQKGIDQGNYNFKQSIEFGGRLTSLSGDFQAYNTFVNLQQGPRLLGFTTNLKRLVTTKITPITAIAIPSDPVTTFVSTPPTLSPKSTEPV